MDGLIEFPGDTIENVEKFGLEIDNKSIDDVQIRFFDCRWRDMKGWKQTQIPLRIVLFPSAQRNGGVEFATVFYW